MPSPRMSGLSKTCMLSRCYVALPFFFLLVLPSTYMTSSRATIVMARRGLGIADVSSSSYCWPICVLTVKMQLAVDMFVTRVVYRVYCRNQCCQPPFHLRLSFMIFFLAVFVVCLDFCWSFGRVSSIEDTKWNVQSITQQSKLHDAKTFRFVVSAPSALFFIFSFSLSLSLSLFLF